jgi:Asp-tRNA(Asn)/Glu-tRNA(Gln) amidotransferase A subunit family amidase
MDASSYASFDAIGLAELVRNGDVSPTELYECALSQIEVYNPSIKVRTLAARSWSDAKSCLRGDESRKLRSV